MKISKEKYQQMYGEYYNDKVPMKELAVKYGITIGRVSQIIKKLREDRLLEKNNNNAS